MTAFDNGKKNETFAALHRAATRRLRNWRSTVRDVSPERLKQLVYELEVRGVELELQNEELRRAQGELEVSRNRFFDLFDLAPVGYVALDRYGRVAEANLTATRMLGQERLRLVGRNFSMFVARPHKALYRTHLRRCLENRQTTGCEIELLTKDGRSFFAHLHSTPAPEGLDDSVHCRMVLTDITARKQAEQRVAQLTEELEERVQHRTVQLEALNHELQAEIAAHRESERSLQESEQRFRAIFESAAEGILLIESETQRLSMGNPAVCDMLGYTCEEIARLSVQDIHPEGDWRPAFDGPPTPAEAERPTVREVRLKRHDRRRFYAELSAYPVTIGGRAYWLGVVRDVTERRRRERLAIKLTQAERRHIGQELHERLGQELTGLGYGLTGLQTTLHAAGRSESRAADQLAVCVQQAVDLLKGIARGLLPTEVMPAELPDALERLAASTEKLYKVPCHFRGSLRAEVGINTKTATELFRIAQEALNNAARHSHAAKITVSLEADDNRVRLEVRDNGVGMPANLPRESGMGLRIMSYRAKLIGATVKLSQADGRGTIVTCILSRKNNYARRRRQAAS